MAVLDVDAVPARLGAVDPHLRVVEEGVEGADGIGAAADGDERARQPALELEMLGADLVPDHRLEVAHHLRIGVRAGGGADEVVGRLDMGDPVAQRPFMASLSVPAPAVTGRTRRRASSCARRVGMLTGDVGRAHEDGGGEPEAAATVAVATPCWPAPVSAMMRVLPIFLAKRIWPRQLLILCEPVWG